MLSYVVTARTEFDGVVDIDYLRYEVSNHHNLTVDSSV